MSVLVPAFLSRNSPQRHVLTVLFLGGFLVVGLLIVRDYGASFDAMQSRKIGMISLRYVAERLFPAFLHTPQQANNFADHQTPLHEFVDRDYGTAYELPVTLAERLLDLASPRTIFQFRHLCTFLVCYLGLLALYGLGRRRYGGDWRTGLAAAGLLVLSPRLFGELFYNDKDAVFMALGTIATYTTVRFVERPTWGWALAHALSCALAIDVRLMALLWPAATVGLLAMRWSRGEYAAGTQAVLRRAGAGGLYLGLLPVLVVALWPYLWEHPWLDFQQAFRNMSHFRWAGTMWYQGRYIFSLSLPWYYVPWWVAISTPLPHLGLLLLGMGAVGRQLVRQRWWGYAAGSRQWQDLLFLGLGLGPLVIVVILHSVLYDGWRQLYFIYPSLLLLAVRGLVALARWLPEQAPRWRRLVVGTAAAGLLTTAGQLIWMHPLQSLYFNLLAGLQPIERYEVDYWGISYGEGLRWILAHDDRPVVRVAADDRMGPPLWLGVHTLPEAQEKRLQMVATAAEADYFMATRRWHPQPYDLPGHVHDIRAGWPVALEIFRLNW